MDARGASLSSAEHWSDADQLGTRAHLQVHSARQGMLLSHLVEEDRGLYHCRVDFKSSPTRNLRIRLDIVVPPRHLLIRSGTEGGRVVSGVIGPYLVGTLLQLRCQVTGGTPTPTVSWWQGRSLLDQVSEYSTEQVTRNTLLLPPLSRADLLLVLTCVAFNSNLTEPITASVTIDIAFAPISVRLRLSGDEYSNSKDGREKESWTGRWSGSIAASENGTNRKKDFGRISSSVVSLNPKNLSNRKIVQQQPSELHSQERGRGAEASSENEIFRSGGRHQDVQKFDGEDRQFDMNRQASTVGREVEEWNVGHARSDIFRNQTAVNETELSDRFDIWEKGSGKPKQEISEQGLTKESSVERQRVETITLREGHKTTVECQSVGSRPPSQYIWKRDGEDLTKDLYETTIMKPPDQPLEKLLLDSGSYSVSSLTLEPRHEDHGSVLSCLAFSPNLPNETVVQDAVLNVLYSPRVSMAVMGGVVLDRVEEGDALHFECKVDSNPPVDKVYWTRDEEGIHHSPQNGVLLTGHRLDILSAKRLNAGRYACFARNSEGGAVSDRLLVLVKYAPVCSPHQNEQFGAGRLEEVNVTCTVDSHPPPLSFRWAFNRSSEMVDIPQSSYWTSSGQTSTLGYQVLTEMDYGSLLCWAINDVGLMKTPCVIRLVPAAKPEAVKDCVIHNDSSSQPQHTLNCTSGWDGGINQTFTLEVLVSRSVYSKSLALVHHSQTPTFQLKGLVPDSDYLLVVTAVNGKGSSPPFTLTYRSPKVAKGLSSTPDVYASTQKLAISWTIFLAMLTGLLLTLLSCLVALLYVIKMKNSEARSARREPQASAKSAQPRDSPNAIICRKLSGGRSVSYREPLRSSKCQPADTEVWFRGPCSDTVSHESPNGLLTAASNIPILQPALSPGMQDPLTACDMQQLEAEFSNLASHEHGCSSLSRLSSASLTISNFGGRSSSSSAASHSRRASLNPERYLPRSPTPISVGCTSKHEENFCSDVSGDTSTLKIAQTSEEESSSVSDVKTEYVNPFRNTNPHAPEEIGSTDQALQPGFETLVLKSDYKREKLLKPDSAVALTNGSTRNIIGGKNCESATRNNVKTKSYYSTESKLSPLQANLIETKPVSESLFARKASPV
ncbi:Immunoglobulin [Trinorchestia longiramus]|nr:Immunoglobulin [Trinorchestia longiramus]